MLHQCKQGNYVWYLSKRLGSAVFTHAQSISDIICYNPIRVNIINN